MRFVFGKKKYMGGVGGFWLLLIRVSFEKQPNKINTVHFLSQKSSFKCEINL